MVQHEVQDHGAQRARSSAPRASPLAMLHAVVFSLGVSTLLIGLAMSQPALLLIAGPCLSLSGVLIWVGSRILFAGPLGEVMRWALGRSRVVTRHLRALLWLLVGVVVTAWGVQRMRTEPERGPPLLEQPLAPRPARR